MAKLDRPLMIASVVGLGGVLGWLIWKSNPPRTTADFAAWAQVAGTMLAIVGSVFAGYLHADRQAKRSDAERFKAAYLLTRAAAKPVIEVERWLRSGASDEDQKERDWKRVRSYRDAWPAWIQDRYEGYLQALDKLDILTLSDAAFVDNVLSVRSRLKWLKANVSQHVGIQKLDKETEKRLSWAARDVIWALCEMRARAAKALEDADSPEITVAEARPFPESTPSAHLKVEDKALWNGKLRSI